jgi:hypothetical protein
MSDREPMTQTAPYPLALRDLVGALSYREDRGWRVWLQDIERDPGSRGLTLVVQRCGPDTYHPENIIGVNHYFPVPPATFDERSWRRWLFDRLGDVDTHERCEDFIIDGERPLAPAHAPGNNPYLVLEYGTDIDRRTSFRGVLDDDGTGQPRTLGVHPGPSPRLTPHRPADRAGSCPAQYRRS